MNVKRFYIATVVIFIYIFAFEWCFHGFLLKDTYIATAELWRPEANMSKTFGWILGGEFLIAFMFCYLFTFGYQNRGLLEGVRYGIYIAVLFTGPQFIQYAVQPIPRDLLTKWVGGNFVELIIAGILLSIIYKPKAPSSLT